MCATFMLLKVHLGKEERPTTKYACAQRFLGLHNRRHGKEHTPPTSEQQQQPLPQSFISVAGEVSLQFQQRCFVRTRYHAQVRTAAYVLNIRPLALAHNHRFKTRALPTPRYGQTAMHSV